MTLLDAQPNYVDVPAWLASRLGSDGCPDDCRWLTSGVDVQM